MGKLYKGGSNSIMPWDRELKNMKYIDLKKAVIALGMPFEDVGNGSYPRLAEFFIKNFYEKRLLERLTQFDEWLDGKFKENGYPSDDPMRTFRLSTTLTDEEQEKLQDERNPKMKTKSLKKAFLKKDKKKKRERDDSTGIFKGTKKALTYELAQKGKTFQEIVPLVLEKFPEAQEKSIKIWISRAMKEKKEKK